MPDVEHPIIFFDGECAGCNGFVRWVLRTDQRQALRVAPLGGETAKKLLGDTDESSIVLAVAAERFFKSEAILRICEMMPGWWKILGFFRLVPLTVRDWVYDFFAVRRQSWSALFNHCALLSGQENARVLQ